MKLGFRHAALPVALVALGAAAVLAQAPAAPATLFRDIASQAGITFRHHAAPEKKYIVESMSGGVAMFDYDNDGRPDLYFVDSLTVETAGDPSAARSALYRNLGNGRFEDVTDKAGVGHPGWGMGVCAADVDGDGWEDLYVTALGGSHLYHNNHDGTFTDATAASGTGVPGWSTGCGFADYDHDGRPRPLREPLREDRPRASSGVRQGQDLRVPRHRGAVRAARPRRRRRLPVPQRRRAGSPTCRRRPASRIPRGYFGLGVAWFDANGDGWPDLYVANDSTPNFLYLNQKDGTFKESGFPVGRRGQRGRRRAGRHGRGARRLRPQRPPQPVRDELLRGVQRPLPRRGGPLHRRVVPLADRGDEPARTSAGATRSSTTTTTAGRI